jgi:hypothetical protein
MICLGALGASLWMLVRELEIPFSLRSLLPTYTMLMACSPLCTHLHEGQLGLVLLVLILGAWASDRSGRPVLTGLLLGTATAIKIFPGFLFYGFALRRQWRVLSAGAATLAAWTLLTVSTLGSQAYCDYSVILSTLGRWRSAYYNLSLFGFWSKLFDPYAMPGMGRLLPLVRSPLLARASYLISAAVVIGLLIGVSRRACSRLERDHAFALGITTIPLLSPVAWDHYLVILLLPLALLRRDLPPSGASRWDFRIILLCLWVSPVFWRRVFFRSFVVGPLQTMTVSSIQTYAVLGLFLLEFDLYSRLRERASGGPAVPTLPHPPPS